MAVVQFEDGRRFVGLDRIAGLIAPTRIDAVPVPTGIDHLLQAAQLDAEQRDEVLARRDPTLDAEAVSAGWPPPLLQVIRPDMRADDEHRLRSYAPPHTNPADEIHHVIEGAIEFGLVLADGSQALAVLQPGDALRLGAGTEHWSVPTADRRATVVVHLSRPPGFAHHYTHTPVRIH